ncbi:MAG: lipopolysaccharide biosynthesis protein [Bacteroidaceae bacterium]|nr:lipopolysaccharide biosynthesis protein [Bacteroidaceae bacterium]
MSNSKELAKNAFWKYAELVSVSLVQILTTFILARFLTPSDYGLIGMVIVFTTISNVFIESGFSQAIIREKDVTRADYSTVFYSNVFISIIIYIILYCSSNAIAEFYHEPKLNEICRITFLALPINACSIVQQAKLQREMQFKKICIISIISVLVSSTIAIIIAYKTKNVWALVLQNILIIFCKTLLLWITTDFIPLLKFSKESFVKYFKFSKNLLISSLIGTIFNNIYILIIGRSYSATDLGLYSQADRIKNLASNTTTQVIQSVSYPILSKINNQTGNIKDAYKEIISICIIFVGFIMSLLIGCAPDLFEFLMGGVQWREAGIFFMLLGINGILYPLHCINQNILLVKGDSKTILWLEIIRRTTMIVILLITLQFNIRFFVFGLSLYSAILLFLNLYFCGKPIKYSIYEQLKDTLPIFLRFALIIVTTMVVCHILTKNILIVRLTISLGIGTIVGLIIFWKQKSFQNMIMLVKSLLNEKRFK